MEIFGDGGGGGFLVMGLLHWSSRSREKRESWREREREREREGGREGGEILSYYMFIRFFFEFKRRMSLERKGGGFSSVFRAGYTSLSGLFPLLKMCLEG